MKCSCGDPDCASTIGFDSETGFLLADSNAPHEMRVVGLYLNAESATLLARQLKSFLLRRADTPSDERTVIEATPFAHTVLRNR